ncbi:hypothetical protein NKG94_15965 [Micromonospora sp. M12]
MGGAGAEGDLRVRTDRPWRGVLVAVTTPFRADLSVNFDQLQEHVRWLAAEGVTGRAVRVDGNTGPSPTTSGPPW